MSTVVINGEGVSVRMRHTKYGRVVEPPLNESYYLMSGTWTVTLTALQGFTIIEASYKNNHGDETLFNLNEDKTIATADVDFSTQDTTHTINVITGSSGDIPVYEVSGFNHVYLVDNKKLRKIMDERLVIESGDPNRRVAYDLGDFIINVLELPFPVLDDLKNIEKNIVLGKSELSVTSMELLSDFMVLDLGNITVPKKYNNSYDYLNTVAKLHLPFIDSIDLELEYVIGHTINVKYVIDFYSGNVTLNITSDKVDKVFYSNNFSIGRNIPFITSNNRKIGSISDLRGLNNGVFNAFIEVIRNKPYEMDNHFNNDITVQTKLINETGYVVVNNAIINTSASLEEKKRIISLLNSGVFIR